MRIRELPSARRPSGLVCAVVLLALTPTARGQGRLEALASRAGIEMVAAGQSGSQPKSQAARDLPWNQLSAGEQANVQEVLDKCAQYRRLPEVRYEVDQRVFRYLVAHPDVAVSTWRAMSISKVQLWQTGPIDYEGQAPDGSEGTAHVVYCDDSQCLLLCRGTYSNPLLPKPITAAALLWMHYDFHRQRDGSQQVHQRTHVFLSFPSAATRTVALLASPVTNMMMDRNLYEISLYARMMSQAVERDPEWIRELAAQLDGVLPQRRQELMALVRRPAEIPHVGSSRPTSLMQARPMHPPTSLHMYRPHASTVAPALNSAATSVRSLAPVPVRTTPKTPVPAVPTGDQLPVIIRLATISGSVEARTSPQQPTENDDPEINVAPVESENQTPPADSASSQWKVHNPNRKRIQS